MQGTKQAVFMLGEEEYGLDIMDVSIIEKVIPVEPVASFPKNLKGIIRLRGDIIPVYSLRRKFGLEDVEPDDDFRFIITNSNGNLVAFEADRMMEIVPLEPDQILEAPSIVKSKDTSYMKAVTNVHDRLVIILNHDGILTEDEQSKIKAVIQK